MNPIVSAVSSLNAGVRNLLSQLRGVDPNLAQKLVQDMQLAELAAQQSAAMKGAPPNEVRAIPKADLFVRLPGVAAIAGAGAAGNAVTSPQYPIQWPFSGKVIGITVGCLNETTNDNYMRSMGASGVSITASSVESIIVDGQGSNYFPFIGATTPFQTLLPFSRRFAQSELWQAQFYNSAGAGVSITPFLVFHVKLDRSASE